MKSIEMGVIEGHADDNTMQDPVFSLRKTRSGRVVGYIGSK